MGEHQGGKLLRTRGQIYVEIGIRTSMERLWSLSQDPGLHPRWDLRFSRIVPTGGDDGGPVSFRYEFRLPFHTIKGTGTSLGHRLRADGQATSVLKFATDDALSPIGPGSGYWRYIPTAEGVRFITGYKYEPGMGVLGKMLDGPVIRPALGWATALSFDRLRLWAERDIDPGDSRNRWIIDAMARASGFLAAALLLRQAVAGHNAGAATALGVTAALASCFLPPHRTVPRAGRCLRHAPDERARTCAVRPRGAPVAGGRRLAAGRRRQAGGEDVDVASIFEQALGRDFDRLHPMLRKRFGVDTSAGYACVGRGVFSEVRRGAWWTVPFLRIGAYRNILFPDQGENVPFTIENYPYVDGLGRPTVTFVRTLQLPGSKRRRFDATMVYSPETGGITDYLGTHQHLATGLILEVLPDGSLHLRSTGQRFYEGFIGFTFPSAFTGTADLYESFDDARGVFTIQMQVRNPVLGFLFGYRGEFTCTFPATPPEGAPHRLRPVREERRQ